MGSPRSVGFNSPPLPAFHDPTVQWYERMATSRSRIEAELNASLDGSNGMVLVLGNRVRTPFPVSPRSPPVFRGEPGGPPAGPPGSHFRSRGLAAQTFGHFNECHGQSGGLLADSSSLQCFACLRVAYRAHLDGCSVVMPLNPLSHMGHMLM